MLAIISVKGLDSQKFLQGQLTNDINLLDNSSYQFTAYLNNKGKMLGSFIANKVSRDEYYLITITDIAESLATRLKMFVLRAKVTIEITDYNASFTTKITQDKYVELESNNYLIISQHENLHNEALWKKYLIEHGIPLIYSQTQEMFIPQHVNFDLLGGVNFKKGCYVGQEIVARTNYLGKVKQRMYDFKSRHSFKIGQDIVSPVMDNQVVGTIVEANGAFGLVSIRCDCINQAFLDVCNSQKLVIYELSYG